MYDIEALEQLFKCKITVFVDKKRVSYPIEVDIQEGKCLCGTYEQGSEKDKEAIQPDVVLSQLEVSLPPIKFKEVTLEGLVELTLQPWNINVRSV